MEKASGKPEAFLLCAEQGRFAWSLLCSMAMRNLHNRRTRTRIYGGVAGESGRPLPLGRLVQHAIQVLA